MTFAGIDIGSRTINLVILRDAEIVEAKQVDSGFDPMGQALSLLEGLAYDGILATGYGRHLFELSFETLTVTEIKAYAVGARFLFPEARAILDIGGQDSKAIALSEDGSIVKFEMNDKCAAGTGKFLEIMADTMGYELGEMGREALKSQTQVNINSMCTVFAESEVISLINKGHERQDIAMGLHKSIARRAASMLKRVLREGPVVFAGGVARNECMVQLIREAFEVEILVPDDPQMVGALGAALIGATSK